MEILHCISKFCLLTTFAVNKTNLKTLLEGFSFRTWTSKTYNRTGLFDRPEKVWSQHGGIWECLLMKLPADQYYIAYIFVCLKSQRCLTTLIFFRICQHSWHSIGQARLQVESIDQAVQIYYKSMVHVLKLNPSITNTKQIRS